MCTVRAGLFPLSEHKYFSRRAKISRIFLMLRQLIEFSIVHSFLNIYKFVENRQEIYIFIGLPTYTHRLIFPCECFFFVCAHSTCTHTLMLFRSLSLLPPNITIIVSFVLAVMCFFILLVYWTALYCTTVLYIKRITKLFHSKNRCSAVAPP